MSDGWVVIPNWDKFQHYKDRDPTWIKLYLGLNSDDDWLALSTAERGMLTTIWVEYARSRGRLRVGKVMQLCGKSARSKHVTSLNHAGFIQVSASKPLALARSREEEEEETASKEAVSSREAYHSPHKNGRGDTPPKDEEKEKIRRKAKFWIDTMIHELEGVDLAYVIADEFRIDDQDLVADLIAYAQERMLGRTL